MKRVQNIAETKIDMVTFMLRLLKKNKTLSTFLHSEKIKSLEPNLVASLKETNQIMIETYEILTDVMKEIERLMLKQYVIDGQSLRIMQLEDELRKYNNVKDLILNEETEETIRTIAKYFKCLLENTNK